MCLTCFRRFPSQTCCSDVPCCLQVTLLGKVVLRVTSTGSAGPGPFGSLSWKCSTPPARLLHLCCQSCLWLVYLLVNVCWLTDRWWYTTPSYWVGYACLAELPLFFCLSFIMLLLTNLFATACSSGACLCCFRTAYIAPLQSCTCLTVFMG